jgi:hypothetical protein
MNTRTLSVLIMAAVVASGCSNSIKFVAHTAVDEDGSVSRTTTLASSGSASWDALQTRYELFPGGTWTESIEDRPPANANTAATRVYNKHYALTRTFARGEAIAADFRRRARGEAGAAENEIAVSARRYWFVDTYHYKETFSDVPILEGVVSAIHQIYSLGVESFAAEIARLDDAISADSAATRIRARFDPLVEDLVSVVEGACFAQNVGSDECMEKLEESPEVDAIEEILSGNQALVIELAELFPPPAGTSPEDWQELLEDQVVTQAEENIETHFESESFDALEDQIFGAHGFGLFESYPFELSVTLPGRIVASNADSEDSGLLSWVFDRDRFVYQKHTLEADSRIVHVERIWFASLLTLLIAVGLFGRRMRRRNR